MKCKKCENEMYLDDRDENYPLIDLYYCCDKCNSQVTVTKNKKTKSIIKENWIDENGFAIK